MTAVGCYRQVAALVVVIGVLFLQEASSQGRGPPPGHRRGPPHRPPGLVKKGIGEDESPERPGPERPGPERPGPERPGSESSGPERPEGFEPVRRQGCIPSLTTMNGGQTTCSGQLIFEDNFNDLEQWGRDVHMAGAPDHEFVVYKDSPWNLYIENGILNIKAFLSEEKYGVGWVSNGTMIVKRCTSNDPELCRRTAFSYNILPPVRSARIHSADRFAFRYGVVEMRVRGPRGDWLYPQLTLKPAQANYGPMFSSGEIRLPSHFGNKFLRETGERGWRGRKLMRAGVVLGVKGDAEPTLVSVESRAPQEVADWSRVFHVVRLKWSPDGFEYSIDGEPVGRGKVAIPHPGGFASLTDNPSDHSWARGGKDAPFDQEFYLSIGLGVGGSNRFPDNVTNGQNGEHPKPWKNTSPKAMLNFWKAKDQWYPTWQLPFLQVSYVKVWAL